MDLFFPDKSARLNATVTISVSLAASASRINSEEENLPVPASSLEWKVRSPILSNDWLDFVM